MAALTNERPTKSSDDDKFQHYHEPYPIEDAVKIWKGSLVAVYKSGATEGEIAPGKASTTMQGLGRATKTVDNADDGEELEVEAGMFWWANSGSDPVVASDVGDLCYIEDDQTVAKTDGTGTLSPAGKVVDIDSSEGVLVLTHPSAF